jgi:ubiquinone/menaquinone biosynthesis C-methylase UbiE
LEPVKERQQQTWASGNYSRVAARIVLASERLAESADLRPGTTALDVACGSGNATIAAARHGVDAIGVDYVPTLLEDARARAVAEGLDVSFVHGDAENLPLEGGTFDTVLSVFGSMFAPDHQRTADEMTRVARPGGRVALASWTPEGFIGQMFTTIGAHVPAPSGVPSPLLWGTDEHLAALFGSRVSNIRSRRRTQSFRYRSAAEFVDYFRRWYGPTHRAFAALDAKTAGSLHEDLVELARLSSRDSTTMIVDAEYLESVIDLT